ncbi:OmpP1/FadL family transporter [Celeribacter marinus]|uniref:OmpP1/FadL family transporter n=1 Tax=Celeribacter marinus TaxID=1397108 RepID=UPI0031784DA9
MKTQLTLAAAIAVGATGAYAGGMDRSGQSIAPLFEDGSYVEFSFGIVTPKVSGAQTGTYDDGAEDPTVVPGLGQSSGNMADSYVLPSAAYKRDLNDKLSFALIWDQPFGADVNYSHVATPAPYVFATSTGTVKSNALTAIGRYKLSDRFAVHAGVRSVTSTGEVALSNGYTMSIDKQTDFGYLVGASYEIPDIALRAAITYSSEITHDFTATDFTGPHTMTTKLPQSVNLDFQTGIAADTLLMASIRWADWTSFDITPAGYAAISPDGDALVSYDNDTFSYTLGVGRRFSEKLSGSATIGYEKSQGGYSGNLGPTDGNVSLALGLKYQVTDATAISGGIRYVKIGDAKTENPTYPTSPDTTLGDFTDNSAVAVGFKISHSF